MVSPKYIGLDIGEFRHYGISYLGFVLLFVSGYSTRTIKLSYIVTHFKVVLSRLRIGSCNQVITKQRLHIEALQGAQEEKTLP